MDSSNKLMGDGSGLSVLTKFDFDLFSVETCLKILNLHKTRKEVKYKVNSKHFKSLSPKNLIHDSTVYNLLILGIKEPCNNKIYL